MAIAVVWVALCFVAGAIAGGKGRSAAGFLFLALWRDHFFASVAVPPSKSVDRSLSRGSTLHQFYSLDLGHPWNSWRDVRALTDWGQLRPDKSAASIAGRIMLCQI
jgi:hypothetical protein